MTKFIIIFLVSLFTAQCLISDPQELNLNFFKVSSLEIGKKGTVVIEINPDLEKHGIVDTSKTTCFQSEITNGKETRKVGCDLWSVKKCS